MPQNQDLGLPHRVVPRAAPSHPWRWSTLRPWKDLPEVQAGLSSLTLGSPGWIPNPEQPSPCWEPAPQRGERPSCEGICCCCWKPSQPALAHRGPVSFPTLFPCAWRTRLVCWQPRNPTAASLPFPSGRGRGGEGDPVSETGHPCCGVALRAPAPGDVPEGCVSAAAPTGATTS